jgi:hypothetical protein
MRDKILAALALAASAAWPIGDITVANGVDEMPWMEAFTWFLAISASLLLPALLLGCILNSYFRSTAVITSLGILFFSFSILTPSLQAISDSLPLEVGAVALFAVLFVFAAIWLLRATRQRSASRLLLCIPPAMLISTCGLVGLLGVRVDSIPHQKIAVIKLRQRPNVYHFLFDGMGRREVISSKIGVDVGDVSLEFQKLGFVVPDDVKAQYPTTWQSISSFMNRGSTDGRMEPPDLVGSSVVRIFRANGYRYVQYGEVFRFAACSGLEDRCLSGNPLELSEFSAVMLKRTPIFVIARRMLLSREASRHLNENLQMIADTPTQRPSYTFSYMVPPHPPFIFSNDCKANQEDFLDYRGWQGKSKGRYGYAYRCVVKAATSAVVQIIARDPSAIIIVSGDHGTMFGQKGYVGRTGLGWTPGIMGERLPVFLAIRAPSACAGLIGKTRRLADIYATIFRCLS